MGFAVNSSQLVQSEWKETATERRLCLSSWRPKKQKQLLVSFPAAPAEQRRGSVGVNQVWRRTPRSHPGQSHHDVDSLWALLELFNVAVDVNIAHRRRLCVSETTSRAASRRKCVIEGTFFFLFSPSLHPAFFVFFCTKRWRMWSSATLGGEIKGS